MKEGSFIIKSISINADITIVWDALTNPEMTKKYYFDCEVISNWNIGGEIAYMMKSEGKEIIAVKGIISAIIKNKLIEHSVYTPQTENDLSKHTIVRYELSREKDQTILSIKQGDFNNDPDENRYNHTSESWNLVLNGLKKIIEGKK